MPKLIVLFCGAVLGFLSAPAANATCDLKKGGSFPNGYDMNSDCDAVIKSSDGDLSVNFHGGIYTLVGHGKVSKVGGYGTPSSMSWSTRGHFFYINDGDGSELDSTIRVFGVINDEPKEYPAYRILLEQKFKASEGCNASQESPNTWGIGWSSDGKKLYVLTQSIVHPTCGSEERFYVGTINVRTGKLISFDPAVLAKKKFRRFLPEYMLSSPK